MSAATSLADDYKELQAADIKRELRTRLAEDTCQGKERATILKHLETIAVSEGHSATSTFNGGVWSEPRVLSPAAKAEATAIRTRLDTETMRSDTRAKLHARLQQLYS